MTLKRLQSWSRASQRWLLDPTSGKLRREKREDGATERIDGFIQTCVAGAPLTVFCDQETWFIQRGETRFALNDEELSIEFSRLGPFTTVRIARGQLGFSCVYSDLLGGLMRRIDPTFDDLDASAADFSRWLNEKRMELLDVSDPRWK